MSQYDDQLPEDVATSLRGCPQRASARRRLSLTSFASGFTGVLDVPVSRRDGAVSPEACGLGPSRSS